MGPSIAVTVAVLLQVPPWGTGEGAGHCHSSSGGDDDAGLPSGMCIKLYLYLLAKHQNNIERITA